MTFAALTLRILLSIALLFNGAGDAMASMHALAAHPDRMVAASTPSHGPAATAIAAKHDGCHEASAQTPSASHHPVVQVTVSVSGDNAAPDCCRPGACHGDCTLHATGSLPNASVVAFDAPRGPLSTSSTSGHEAPALPHLIRPPIG